MEFIVDKVLEKKRQLIPDKNDHAYAFTIRPSKVGRHFLEVRLTTHPAEVPPVCFFQQSTWSSPDLVFTRSNNGVPGMIIGESTLKPLSGKAKMIVHGQPVQMKQSTWSGSCDFDSAPLGSFRWKSSSWELQDKAGTSLARLKSEHLGRWKIDILIPCDERFIDLVLLTGLSAKMLEKAVGEISGAAGDAGGAAAGV